MPVGSVQSSQRAQATRQSSSSQPVLRQGSNGPAVRELQQKLNTHGANLSVDGDFGPKTARAVESFQRRNNLSADGVVGPKTWGALGGAPVNNNNNNNVNNDNNDAGPTRRVTGYRDGRPFQLNIASIGDGEFMSAPAAAAYNRMKAAAARDGVDLNAVSGFRTNAEQTELYRRYRNGTGNLAAPPGYSEHQNGIAVDIQTNRSRNSPAYRWLSRNAGEFGFRNTVPSEPWHWEFRR